MSERYSAVLTWFTGDKGYGFLVELNGREEFVRYIAAPSEGFRILTEGDRFEFSVASTPNGFTATEIVAGGR